MSSAATTATTAESTTKMSPEQARGLANYLLFDLQQEIPVTVRVIEAAPADKLSYSPDEKSKNGLALIRHVVQSDIWFLNAIADGKFDGSTNDESDACGINTPSEAAARYRTGIPAAMDRIRSLSDEQLAADLDFFGVTQAPAVALLGMMVKHSIHHRGQLSCYLRSMGGKVPGIYGPSADAEYAM